MHRIETAPGSGSWTWQKTNPLKNGPLQKTGPQGLKLLPSFSSNMKDNVEVIHFHIKSWGVLGLVFVQIMFENYTLNLYFVNTKIGIKKTIAISQPLLASNVSACLIILMQPRFKWKHIFLKMETFFVSSSRRIFTKKEKLFSESLKKKKI